MMAKNPKFITDEEETAEVLSRAKESKKEPVSQERWDAARKITKKLASAKRRP